MRKINISRDYLHRARVLLAMLITLSVIITGCEGSQLYIGAEAGPIQITVAVDNNGNISITGDISPKIDAHLGPVGLTIGVQQTIELAETSPYTLFVVWQDETGEVYQKGYEIGEEFTVNFSGGELIDKIYGDNDSVVVAVRIPQSNVDGYVANESGIEQGMNSQSTTEQIQNEKTTISPEQFIINYYNEISKGNYQKSWAMLSDHFKKTYNSSGYQPYADWWNTVDTAEVLSTKIESQNSNAVTLLVEIKYFYKNGQIDTYDLMEFAIIPFENTWQINDASLISGNP